MSAQTEQGSSIPPLDRFHEIELEKVFDGIVATQNLRIQLASFFGTANLALLTLGFSSHRTLLLFIAGALIWVFLVIDVRTSRSLAVYYYRGLQLRVRFATNDDGVYVGILPGRLALWVREVSQEPQQEAQIDKLSRPPLKALGVSAFWIPLVASLVEISIGLALWLVFSWPVV